MAFDISTYVPGDAWATPDFFTRALAAPTIQVSVVAPGEATPASYFEYRMPNGGQRFIDVAVEELELNSTFEVVLERSINQGGTWGVVKTYTEPSAESVPCTSAAMWRLRLISNASANNIGLVLAQSL
jgi:hypothetical protein